jgi:hypothetical protein
MKLSVSIPDDLWNRACEATGTERPSSIIQAALRVALEHPKELVVAVPTTKSRKGLAELTKRVEMLEALLLSKSGEEKDK